ncbi:MAG: efflux transporter outer membrane subunit [Nitrospirales bacterium]
MRSRTNIFLLALFALAGMSCAMGPDYTRPDIETSDQFRMSDTEGESIANLPWWELLHDEELQNLIRIALRENKSLQKAAATVEEFQARAMIAKMDFAPQLSVSSSGPAIARQSNFAAPGFPNPFNYYIQGNLAWEIDIWGRIRRSNEAARADLLSQEESRRAVVLSLVSGVAQAYFDLLQFDMQLDIAKRTLESWKESVAIARARLRQGISSKLDADQFESERANAAARVAQFERQMIQKENELSVLLGRNSQTISRGVSLTEQVMPPVVPPGLPSELLKRRPDILQVEEQLAAATARIGMAKADRFPKISITGLMGYANPQFSQLVKGGGKANGQFAEAGPSLLGPVLNASVLGFQQDAVEAQAKQVLADYEQTILVAFKEVEDALVAVRTADSQRNAQEEQVTALRSALRLANLRYKGGLTSYVDVLIAKRDLFVSELELTSTHRLHLVSMVQLYKALGGGWSPESPEETIAISSSSKQTP